MATNNKNKKKQNESFAMAMAFVWAALGCIVGLSVVLSFFYFMYQLFSNTAGGI